jgi:hypothetical protein
MDLARAPRRTARKKGSVYENDLIRFYFISTVQQQQIDLLAIRFQFPGIPSRISLISYAYAFVF